MHLNELELGVQNFYVGIEVLDTRKIKDSDMKNLPNICIPTLNHLKHTCKYTCKCATMS